MGCPITGYQNPGLPQPNQTKPRLVPKLNPSNSDKASLDSRHRANQNLIINQISYHHTKTIVLRKIFFLEFSRNAIKPLESSCKDSKTTSHLGEVSNRPLAVADCQYYRGQKWEITNQRAIVFKLKSRMAKDENCPHCWNNVRRTGIQKVTRRLLMPENSKKDSSIEIFPKKIDFNQKWLVAFPFRGQARSLRNPESSICHMVQEIKNNPLDRMSGGKRDFDQKRSPYRLHNKLFW